MILTSFARWTRSANASLGDDGYGISAAGLSGSFETLRRAIKDGLARSHDI